MNDLLAQASETGPIINPVIEAILGSGRGDLAISELMARLYRTIVIVGALALLLYMAWGGISWITGGNDEAKVEQAKNRITNAVIGMAVLVAVVAIAIFLSWVFGFNILNPGGAVE